MKVYIKRRFMIYYIPNMDFEAIDFLRENILERILYWAEQS